MCFNVLMFFILSLFIGTIVYCPICITALQTLLKTSYTFYKRLAGAMRPSITSLLGGRVSAWAFCSFHKGNAVRNADLELSFKLKFACLLPSDSWSGVFKTNMSMTRSASKYKQV